MKYVSTRGGDAPKSFCEVVLEGLCRDGGLSMPETIPHVSRETLNEWRNLPSYSALALEVASLYATDIPREDLKKLVESAYNTDNFAVETIISERSIGENVKVLGLSEGPTFAFKDMAMQFLGQLFPYVLEKADKTLNIVGATSGDTGSSAIHAMKGKPRINVVMLSPHNRMSAFQTAQMYSVQESNIYNIAVEGVFDDCHLVKELNNDIAFKEKYHLGAVNSINFARILAQIIYYFKGYFMTTSSNDEEIDVVIPSGNFGNIFAGIMARQMGLPIRKLILATNENNVLDEFFKTGVYKPRASKEVHLTSSPSMDIAKASNFERFIYLIAGSAKTKALWDEIDTNGYFDLTKDALWAGRASWNIESGESTHQNRIETIQKIYADVNELIDPHTADGVFVGSHFLDGTTQVCLETAKPIKFYETIKQAVNDAPFDLAEVEKIEALPQSKEVMANDAALLRQFIESALN